MLIGSRALSFWLPEFQSRIRPETDWDIISESTDIVQGVEWHNPSEYLSGEAVSRFSTKEVVTLPDGSRTPVCSLQGLAAIKRSHLALDWNFNKHMTQYVRHLKPCLNMQDWDFIKAREKITLEKARQRDIKLNKSKDAFFDDNITKKYDHDYLHELVAFYDRPLYTRINSDGQEVLCSQDKWLALSPEDKIKCIQEETYVIAIERFLVPSGWQHSFRGAYFKSVQKVATTLTSGWFRDYSIDNWEDVCNAYDSEVFIRVQHGLGGDK